MFSNLTSKRSGGRNFDSIPKLVVRPPRMTPALGSIIWYAMLRLTATVLVSWYLRDYFGEHYSEWWIITIAAIYGIAVYPAQIQYEHFRSAHKKLIEGTLCSSCRYFNADGLHCQKLDEHVTELYLPCDGLGWEPHAYEDGFGSDS